MSGSNTHTRAASAPRVAVRGTACTAQRDCGCAVMPTPTVDRRHVAQASLIGTREASSQCYDGVGDPSLAAKAAQSLLLAWDAAWREHTRRMGAAGRRPSVGRCFFTSPHLALARPLVAALIAEGLHAAATLAAPMLLRSTLNERSRHGDNEGLWRSQVRGRVFLVDREHVFI